MKREPYMKAGEGDAEAQDVEFKKKKGWDKFFKTIDGEISGGKKRKKSSGD